MEKQTINPFPSLNSDVSNGLDFVIANIPSPSSGTSPTVDDLNAALVEYIQNLFSYNSSNALDNVELNSYLPSAINAYINNELDGITCGQVQFVFLLLDKIKKIPPLQILDFIAEIEEQIGQSGLSLPEQNQLFMATAVAAVCYNYWLNQINPPSGTTSPWAPYLNTSSAVNIANLPYLITAAIQAALYFCFKGNYVTDSSQPPKISGPNYVTVLTASIGVAAGIMIFQWVQKINIKSIQGNDEINTIFNINELSNPKQSLCILGCKEGCKKGCKDSCIYSGSTVPTK